MLQGGFPGKFGTSRPFPPSAPSASTDPPGAGARQGPSTRRARASRDEDASAPRKTVLVIDDDIGPDDAMIRLLALEGWDVECARTGGEGLTKSRATASDAVILDLQLPDLYGLTVLERLVVERPTVPVLVVTGCYGEPESEALARRLGARGFARKPLDGLELSEMLAGLIDGHVRFTGTPEGNARRVPTREPEGRPLDERPAGDVVAVSASMQAVMTWVVTIAPTDVCVLLTGETGTGKELIARAIHRRSRRAGCAFVPVNCGALPESLLVEELFGHRKGTFTGATRDRVGLIEAADHGTLFLDEVAEMAPSSQLHLLRVLEDWDVRRLGENRGRRVDVRVIGATNRPLADEVAHGRFRQDLYFRLAVAQCHLPPLRERSEDVEALVTHWLPQLAARLGRPVVGLAPETLAVLRAHSWPGNVRELRNVIEYAVCITTGPFLTARDVAVPLSAMTSPQPKGPVFTADTEGQDTLRALDASRWNRTGAARLLGVSRTTLWRRLRRYKPRGPEGGI